MSSCKRQGAEEEKQGNRQKRRISFQGETYDKFSNVLLADDACLLDLLPPVRYMELRPSTWYWRGFRFTVVFDKGGNPNGWEAACIMNHEDGGHCRKRLVHKSGAAPDVIDLVQRSLKFWCLQCGHATRVAHRDTTFPDEIPDDEALNATKLVMARRCNMARRYNRRARPLHKVADGACVLDLLPPVRDMELRPSTSCKRQGAEEEKQGNRQGAIGPQGHSKDCGGVLGGRLWKVAE